MVVAVFLSFYRAISIDKSSSANDYLPFYGGVHTISIVFFEFCLKFKVLSQTLLADSSLQNKGGKALLQTCKLILSVLAYTVPWPLFWVLCGITLNNCFILQTFLMKPCSINQLLYVVPRTNIEILYTRGIYRPCNWSELREHKCIRTFVPWSWVRNLPKRL